MAELDREQEQAVARDKQVLHEMGYAQELLRRMGGFQNFAVSFSIICILSGGLNSFGQGISSIGGAAVGFGWPFAVFFSLMFALAMGQIGSAYPTAGGLYHWGSILGGRFVGWVTAWFNLVGLVTVLAAINVGTYLFLVGSVAPILGIDPATLTPTTQAIVVGVITITQALFNHLGIRLTTKLTDFSGYLIFGATVLLVGALLAFAPSLDIHRLWTWHNYSGDAGGGVWPQSSNLTYLFALSLLLPAYTVTGFDASAHTAEETIGASRNIPRGMIHAVVWSALFGFIMLAAIILAAPDMDKAAAQGFGSFFWIMDQTLPTPLKLMLYVMIGVSQYLCGLATVTSASRMIFAFARDGGLPASGVLRSISHRFRTPVVAIWTVAVLSVGFTLYAQAYTIIAAVCTMFLYISYLLPIVAGLLAYRRSWTHMGPFDIGLLYPVVAVLCIIGAAGLIFVGVQPPNDLNLTILIAVIALAIVVWFGLESRRFKGPPVGEEVRQRQAAILAAERAVGET